MPSATVDVIIPLFNGERFIERTLRSVLDQTVPASKLVVVDDGSTDGGVALVNMLFAEYKGPTATELVQQPNSGPNAARNLGMRHCSSSFVAFCDADDVWMPGKIEQQLRVFEHAQGEDLQLVYCQGHWIDAYDEPVEGLSLNSPEPLRGRVFDRLLLRNVITGSASSAMVRRSVFSTVGTFDESLRASEDYDMWLRIAQVGSIDLAEADLVGIRRHPYNTTKSTLYMLEGLLRFNAKWFEQVKDRPDVLNEWGHLIALFAAQAPDRKAARRLVRQILRPAQRRALFARAGGSLRTYVLLKRVRALLSPEPKRS